MNAARTASPRLSFPICLNARILRTRFARISRFADVLLFRLALLAMLAVGLGSAAQAQTAHLSSVQDILSLPSALNYPQQVAVDGSGNIYIADAYNKRVLKLTPSPSGGFTQSTIGTGLDTPYGVAVDASGNVYIADIFLTTLLKETPSGNGYVQSTIGSNLYDVVAVAVDKQGNVYGVEVNNSFVGTMFKEALSGGTYTQTFIPVPGTHGVDTVAVDGNGNLFVNDGWDGGQVYMLQPIGNSLYTSTEILANGGALAVDANNNLFVAGYMNIYELTPHGSGLTTTFTTSYIPMNGTNTPYGYFGPAGVAVDANGNIYFTDIYTYELVEEAKASGNFGAISVGISSYPVSLFFTADTTGFLGSTSVSTEGAAALDFTDAGTGGCYGGTSLYPGNFCQIDVTFTPTAAGVRSGAAELLDSSGNPFAAGYVQGTGIAPLVSFSPGTAINENILSHGSAVAVDAQGNLFTVAAGSSTAFKDAPGGGPSSWSEAPIGSGLGSATGIAIDGGGNLYIADQSNREIVKETLTSTGYTQSVITNHSNGLNQPAGIAVDESGTLYVSDTGANAVRVEAPSAGGYVQSTLPTSALNQPNGVAVDSIGAVYIADTNHDRVLKETPANGGYIESTIASGLSSPTAVAVDAFGNVYISETTAGVVLKETLVAGGYVQSTIASGIAPYGLALDGNLNLYIAGSSSQSLIKLDVADAPVLTFASTPLGSVSADSPQTLTVANSGNAALTFPIPTSGINPLISANFTLNSSGATACTLIESTSSSAGSLAAGASCTLAISFAPVALGGNSGSLVLTDNNENATSATQTISLSGNGAAPAVGTSTSLGSSPDPSSFGQTVAITATVAQLSGTTMPTGTVQFSIDGINASVPVALSGGVATYNASTLSAGSHSIGAVYSPVAGSGFTTSTATALSQTVNKATSTVAWTTPAAITYGTLLSATQLDASSTVAGSFSYTPALGVVLAAGPQTLSVTFTPTDTADYSTATQTVQLTVNKAPLSVTVNNQSMNFGGTVPSLTGTLAGVVGSDGITATYATTGSSSSPVGPYPITATLNDPNSKLSNYTVTNTPGTLTVNKATATITWAAPAAIIYGTPLNAAQLDASSTVAGSFNYTPALGAVLAAGSQALSVTFTPTDTTDYSTATQTVQLTVNRAPLSVTVNNQSISYGGMVPTLTGTLTGVVGSDGITATYATTGTSSSHVGGYPITATLNDPNSKLGNYAVTNTPGTLTINKAAPTVTWETPAAIVSGTALSATQLDATASAPGAFVYTPAAGSIPAVGSDTLSVTFTPTDATNYSAATATVTLTVNNPVPVAIDMTPVFVSIGSTGFTLTVNGSGFMPNSTVYWGGTALTTLYANAGQLTARVPASAVSTAGVVSVTVQTPAPGGGTSNTLQFEIDSATSGSVNPPVFSIVSDSVTPGSTAGYPVTLPSSATNISVSCLNLPAGASCSYSATTGAVTITTSATTPAGMYTITLVFTETLPGAGGALILFPFLLLPLASARKSKAARRVSQMICVGIMLIAVATAIGCGGSSQSQTSQTHTVTSSGSVSLTVQ
jgi:sugar lactone lactonase YvrE